MSFLNSPRNIFFPIALLSVMFGLTTNAIAQDPSNGNGIQPFETHEGEISLDTLNVHIDIPLVSKTGVTDPFTFGLHYNSEFWVPASCADTNVYSPCWQPNASVWGWTPDATQMYGSYIVSPITCYNGENGLWYLSYEDANATFHPIAPHTFVNSPGILIGQGTMQADDYCVSSASIPLTDGSGLTLNVTYPPDAVAANGPYPGSGVTPTVITSDGTIISPGFSYVYGSFSNISGIWSLPNYISGYYTEDLNHNYISTPSQISWALTPPITPAGPFTFTDTLGVGEITISPEVFQGSLANDIYGPKGPAGPCASSASETYTYPNASGLPVTLTCTQYQIQTHMGCTATYDGYQYQYQEWPAVDWLSAGNSPFPFYAYLITTITLADGSTYNISYESQIAGTVDGRISSITYPNGNVVSYTYGLANCNGFNAVADGSIVSLTRTDASGTWTYTRSIYEFGSTTTVTGPTPASNQSVYVFRQQQTAPNGFFLVEEQDYQGSVSSHFCSSTTTTNCLLKTTTYCYNGNQANCGTTASAPVFPITQKDIYTTYAGMSASNRVTRKYDSYGNIIETDTYDFGATTPAFKTVNTGMGQTWNGSFSSPACTAIGNGVNNVPCRKETVDINGNPIGNVFYTYNAAGNLLATSTWVSGSITAGTYLQTSTTYNSNGTPARTTDPNDNSVTVTYGTCSSGLPTAVSASTGSSTLTTEYGWDTGCNGAVVTSITGMNGYSSSALYTDPLWRLTSYTDQEGNSTTYSYTPTTFESILLFGGSIVDDYQQENVSAQTVYSQAHEANGPSVVNGTLTNANWDTVQSGVSWNGTGQVTTTTMPCTVAKGSGCSTPLSTVTHDALGRMLVATDGGGGTITNTYIQSGTKMDVLAVLGPTPNGELAKQAQKEYNGLGQLLSVCRLSSSAGSVSCGQVNGGTGYLTTYTYDTAGHLLSATQGQQTHSATYDIAGRPLTVSYPESGTTQYFYDSAPATPGVACSTLSLPTNYSPLGSLLKVYDANGNTTCFSYDTLGRTTGIAYSGPNFDGSNSYYIYDSATVDGVAMTNAQGLIAEAYTAATLGGTKITDEGFSYTQRGELSDVYESTPNSGGYYHTNATYFPNGGVQYLTYPTGSVTYVLDGKGRVNELCEGTHSGCNIGKITLLVSSTTYNAADQITAVEFSLLGGSADWFTYDPNTGRMLGYSSEVENPYLVTGNLTWNPNGSLQQLAVTTDTYNAGGVQTCAYGNPTTGFPVGYDEFGRLLNVNCVNSSGTPIWTQVFSYDQYDNLTKAGGTYGGQSWNPGYNAANNRYTLSGISYDANGNLLNDSIHSWTWNQDNRPLTVSGGTSSSVVYDAFGRMAEHYFNSTYTEPLLSPIGNLGLMSTTTLSQLRIPAPANTFDLVNNYDLHQDWLGSARLITGATTIDRAFAPYGEPYNIFGATTYEDFTGDRQDLVAGVFDTPSRELDPIQGRWISPDPAHASWNAYAYSTNPLVTIDPSGAQDDAVDESQFDESQSQQIEIQIPFLYQNPQQGNSDTNGSQDTEAQEAQARATFAQLAGGTIQAEYSAAPDTAGTGPVNTFPGTSLTPGPGLGSGPIGPPGFWTGLIPIYGSGRSAINDFQTGHWGWGLVQTGLAISDVFLVKSLATAVGKVGIEGLAKLGGSSVWRTSVRPWLTEVGWAEFKGQQFHHWLVPQSGWGRMVPNGIKNQPWNLVRMPEGAAGQALHTMLRGGTWGAAGDTMSMAERLWFGSPTWSKILLANSLLRGTAAYEPQH